MNPLVTFAAGIALGAFGVRYGHKRGALTAIRTRTGAGTALVRGGLDRAANQFRDAAISSLSVVETQSGQLRQRLEGETAMPEADSPKKATPAKRSPRKIDAAGEVRS